jgi:hypothetical protein
MAISDGNMTGLEMSSDMIASREAALFHTLDNPDRRHESDGFGVIHQPVNMADSVNISPDVPIVGSPTADLGMPEAQIAPLRLTDEARHDSGSARHEAGMILPTDPAERKNLPITTGVLDYFPRALAEVARVSKAGSDQHHPGQPLHWEKGKSVDHADCIARHLLDRFSRDSDGQRHAAKLAWRALALLETLLEGEQ